MHCTCRRTYLLSRSKPRVRGGDLLRQARLRSRSRPRERDLRDLERERRRLLSHERERERSVLRGDPLEPRRFLSSLSWKSHIQYKMNNYILCEIELETY